MPKNFTKGSEWRKWDLHVHTPSSICNNYGVDNDQIWEKFIIDLENLPAEFSVLGINDYFFLDGYERLVKEKENGRLNNIDLLLPVIEFRIKKFAGIEFGPLKRINLHVIFSEEIKVDTIKSQFLQTLEHCYYLKTGAKWARSITKESVSELGAEVKKDVPSEKLSEFSSDLIEGFNNLNLDEEKIFESLRKECFNGKYLTAIGKTEWSELKWSEASIAEKKSIINCVDIVFTASESFEKFVAAKESLHKQNVNELLLDCSDAHNYSNSADKDRIGNCFTWIKADPTFEGLKQIIYEPNSRLAVQDIKPISPVKKIERIKIDFPANTKITMSGKEDEFCFSGAQVVLNLSDYFNCFIGGRGTGKSTLLNMIVKAYDSKNGIDFFKKNRLTSENTDIDINQHITIDKNSDSLEFLEQNQIEQFALDSNELTKAIYKRIKRKEQDIHESETDLVKEISEIDILISNILKEKYYKQEILNLKKQFENSKKLTDTINSEEYSKLINRIQLLNKDFLKIKSYRNRVELLNRNVSEILEKNDSIDENTTSKYITNYNEFLSKLANLKKSYLDIDNFSDDIEEEIKTERIIDQLKNELENFLKTQGLMEDNLEDVKDASTKTEELAESIQVCEENLRNIEKEITKFDLNRINEKKKKFENIVQKTIKDLTDVLDDINKKNPNEIDKITINMDFDIKTAKDMLFDEFYSQISAFENMFNSKKQHAKECLLKIEPLDVLNEKIKYDELKKLVSGTSQYNLFLSYIFEQESFYNIYKYLIIKHFFNSFQYLKIDVTYKGKPMYKSSFGQRCTAVIVIMLLFGNDPIIIDEPEAHLDSQLIAKYLVNLIKKEKVKRQIIFATHNANFVINADAEQIYILEMPENLSQFTQTTIENIRNRDKLMRLEGGDEAFKLRERKYEIN